MRQLPFKDYPLKARILKWKLYKRSLTVVKVEDYYNYRALPEDVGKIGIVDSIRHIK